MFAGSYPVIENIILDYKNQLEFNDKFQLVINAIKDLKLDYEKECSVFKNNCAVFREVCGDDDDDDDDDDDEYPLSFSSFHLNTLYVEISNI